MCPLLYLFLTRDLRGLLAIRTGVISPAGLHHRGNRKQWDSWLTPHCVRCWAIWRTGTKKPSQHLRRPRSSSQQPHRSFQGWRGGGSNPTTVQPAFAVPLTDSHTTIPVGMVCVMAPSPVLVLVIKAGATRIAFRNKQASGINRNGLCKTLTLLTVSFWLRLLTCFWSWFCFWGLGVSPNK